MPEKTLKYENADYWFFKIDKGNNLSDISHENNLWLYTDNGATETYKFQEDTGIEILEIDFSIESVYYTLEK